MGRKEGMLPNDVEIHTSPWVSGTRAVEYYGPVAVEQFVEDHHPWSWNAEDWTKLILELYDSLRNKCFVLGGNAIVGFEFSIDAFCERQQTPGVVMAMVGTAALLVPLFDE